MVHLRLGLPLRIDPFTLSELEEASDPELHAASEASDMAHMPSPA